jgi:hypothetical protein
MSESDRRCAELRAENDELTRRLELVDAELRQLRDETLARRAEVRALAEALPLAVSRRTLLGQMVRDVMGHPDKGRMTGRAVRKVGRAPGKLVRSGDDPTP